MTRLKDLRRPALIVAILAAVWAAGWTGALDRPSGWIYDLFTAYPATVDRPNPRVLLIEIPAEEDPTAARDWAPLLDQLFAMGAEQVVFSVTPRGPDTLFERAAESGRVVFGRRLVARSDDPELLREEELPAAATALPTGISARPVSPDGIHRLRLTHHAPLRRDPMPLLEVVAAAQRLGEGFAPPGRGSYRVNFLAGSGYLPRISAPAALAGGLIPELVRGRSVLIGPQPGGLFGGVHSPLSPVFRPLTVLEFQGFALDTLLQDRAIAGTPPWATLLLLLAAAALSVAAYQWLSLKVGATVTAAAIAVYFLFGWLALGLLNWWTPVAELALAQFALFAAIFTHRKIVQDQALRQLLLHVSARARERVTPVGFLSARDPWHEVIGMVNQALDLKRLIFLERVQGDHRVREVAAHNCSIQDIHEMRRDFERFPYTAALAARGPITVQERIFLRPLEQPEQQFLAPLLFAGEVQGFWAFSVEPATLEATPAFLSIAGNFADQIGELMYHRRMAQGLEARAASRVQQALQLESPEEAHRELGRTHALLERRLDTSEAIADHLGSAFVLYDMFGNILQINKQMEAWAREAGLRIFEMSAIELADALTGQEGGRSRAYVRHVLVERKPITLPIALPQHPDRLYLLSVRPVGSPQAAGSLPGAPFQLLGILLEIADASQVATLYRRREQLTQHIANRMNEDLARIERATGRLRGGFGGPDLEQALREVDVELEHLKGLVGSAEKFFGLHALSEDAGFYPIDPRAPLEEALRASREGLGRRHISVETHIPALRHLAMAETDALREALAGVLDTLIEDAIENSTLHVALREDAADGQHWIRVELRNTGFGMPAERLQSMLEGAGEGRQMHPFQLARTHAEYWGGRFEAETGIGRGITATLVLKAFTLGSAGNGA